MQVLALPEGDGPKAHCMHVEQRQCGELEDANGESEVTKIVHRE